MKAILIWSVINVDGWIKQSWTLCFQRVLERCFLSNIHYVMSVKHLHHELHNLCYIW